MTSYYLCLIVVLSLIYRCHIFVGRGYGHDTVLWYGGKIGDFTSYGSDPRRIRYAGSETDGLSVNYKQNIPPNSR